MLLPVFYLLGQDIPEADMYHTVCTGYGGMLGAMAHVVTGKPLVLTEHGIYSREREEELIRADWVESVFKRRWIQFFYMLSNFCYENSTVITSLFDSARAIQIELGAPPDKCQVIRNGVDYNAFAQVPEKTPRGKIVIGAAIRLARIKDVKTMIYAFYELTKRYGAHGVELHILGDTDDEEYAHECHQLVADLGLRNLFFDGHQNTLEFMEKFDFTILSSISEGQPLCLLESMAAARPVVCTDVGSCRELVQGASGDNLGPAGICVAPMDRIALADAMDTLCSNTGLRRQMGLVGQKRVSSFYRTDIMMDHYRLVYDETMKMLESESPRSLGSHDVGEED